MKDSPSGSPTIYDSDFPSNSMYGQRLHIAHGPIRHRSDIFLCLGCSEISSFFHSPERSHDKMLPETQSAAASTRLSLAIIYRLVECCGLTPVCSVRPDPCLFCKVLFFNYVPPFPYKKCYPSTQNNLLPISPFAQSIILQFHDAMYSHAADVFISCGFFFIHKPLSPDSFAASSKWHMAIPMSTRCRSDLTKRLLL